MLRQYVYFCTSKASKLSTKILGSEPIRKPMKLRRQYVYFCTSKASKLSTSEDHIKREPGDAASVCVLLYQ
jgi:hypothetical protein